MSDRPTTVFWEEEHHYGTDYRFNCLHAFLHAIAAMANSIEGLFGGLICMDLGEDRKSPLPQGLHQEAPPCAVRHNMLP